MKKTARVEKKLYIKGNTPTEGESYHRKGRQGKKQTQVARKHLPHAFCCGLLLGKRKKNPSLGGGGGWRLGEGIKKRVEAKDSTEKDGGQV